MRSDLALIAEAAREAGRMALELRARGLTIEHKAGGSPLTNGDLAVDAFLRSHLCAARASYGWLSEETSDGPERMAAERLFIVDPIDGTSAYMKGRPWFVISIAVVQAGRPVAAAIYAPAVDELYTAAQGEGAACDGEAIGPSGSCGLQACRMLGDLALFDRPGWREPWPAMRVERRNAIAYRMALVGAGDFDAAVSLGWKYDWDLAAGDLIAREAGARVSDARGAPLLFNTPRAQNDGLICSTPLLHPLILSRTAPIDLPLGA